jgi:hypothetical protein
MRKLERPFARLGALKGLALWSVVLSAFLATAVPFAPAQAKEDAKWFVLRHDQTRDCWTGLLIQIGGNYRHEFAQKAGGPFETKAQALKREKELEQDGTCKKPEMQ